MAGRWLYVRVGMLLLGSVALLLGLVFLFTGDHLRHGVAYETYFRESVQGLDVGAPVKFRGVTLGRVTNIGLVSAEYGASVDNQVMDAQYRMIVVRFKIDPKRVGHLPDTTTAVAAGLRAKLANQGLTGVMYLELDFVTPDEHPYVKVPWQPEDQFVPSVPSTISQVQDAVQDVLARVQKIDFDGLSKNAVGLLADLRHELKGGGDVQATLGQAQSAIAALRDQVVQADLPALTAQFRKTGTAFETLADGRKTREVLARASAALDKLPTLIASLQSFSGRAGNGISDLQAQLAPILEDARVAVENLREASEAIRRDPGSVLLGGAPPRHAR
jgi:paraquat-inducible protein B